MDAFSVEAHRAQAQFLVCGKGCDGCCRLRRTAFGVEVAAVRRYVGSLAPPVQLGLRARAASPAVVAGERCVFLEESGGCAVYPVRPMICRTHGPLVRSAAGPHWCALNFAGMGPEAVVAAVAPSAVLALETVDALLAVVAERFQRIAGGPLRAPLEAALEEPA